MKHNHADSQEDTALLNGEFMSPIPVGLHGGSTLSGRPIRFDVVQWCRKQYLVGEGLSFSSVVKDAMGEACGEIFKNH